ncbi:MAG: HAMP domain-containing sensor histidine kinase [bacterium]|nr:HAMP domain-containing sensor histidine kinase [bacterium]
MKNLLKSFEVLLPLETEASQIYSAILDEFPGVDELAEKISHIRNEEIYHIQIANSLIKIGKKAEKRKTGIIIPSKNTRDFLQNDFNFKGYLLNTLTRLLDAKIQSFMLINLLNKKDVRYQRARQTRDNITKIIIHNLKSPLTITKWISDLLLEGKKEKLTGEQKEMVEKIKTANSSMFSLVKDVLEMNQAEEKKKLKKEKINTTKILEEIIKESNNLIKITGQKINFQPPKKDIIVLSNAEVLKKVLSAILTNAISYGKKGGKIFVKTEKEKNGKVLISVADNGIGIPQKEQKDIFKKLFRASNAKVLYSEGSGLGLYIAKELVKNIGGKIWFKSQEGKGSEFFILI